MQIRVYLRMLQDGWWLIALAGLSALVIALSMSFTITPLYRATASFLISPNNDIMSGRDIVNSLTALDKRVIGVTYAEVLSSDRIYRDTSDALQIDYSILRQYRLSAVVLPEASILEFSASGPDPRIAAIFANGAGQQGIEYITSIYDVYSITFLDAAEAPGMPYNLNPGRDAGLALVLGMAFGAALALLRGHLSPPLEFIQRQRMIDGLSTAYTRNYTLERIKELMAGGTAMMALGIVRFEGLPNAKKNLPYLLYVRLIRQATRLLRDELRSDDFIGRWDDRSFVVALPEASIGSAQQVINRIASRFKTPLSVVDGEPTNLQPHYAITTLTPENSTDPAASIELALTQAKQQDSAPIVPASVSA